MWTGIVRTAIEGEDRGQEDGVGTGMVCTGMVGDGVQFLFPCRPLVWVRDNDVNQSSERQL